jgi:hypothetical protein
MQLIVIQVNQQHIGLVKLSDEMVQKLTMEMIMLNILGQIPKRNHDILPIQGK